MVLVQSAVRRWLAQGGAEQQGQPDVDKPRTTEHQRICRLEAKNKQLRVVRDGGDPQLFGGEDAVLVLGWRGQVRQSGQQRQGHVIGALSLLSAFGLN